jgi:hypothetical protein
MDQYSRHVPLLSDEGISLPLCGKYYTSKRRYLAPLTRPYRKETPVMGAVKEQILDRLIKGESVEKINP